MSATAAFFVYGRVNCFYTANSDTQPTGSETTGLESLGNNAYGCDYPYHPLPLCDPDPDNGSDSDWRAYTRTEIAGVGTAGTLFGREAGDDCGGYDPPPVQAGFDADPCVTATMQIGENRVVSSSAAPGVLSSDRTLAVTAGRTAWDLDIMRPHPATASPPIGTGDASGCADGSESRAGHSSASGGAARRQTPAPSYASSSRTNTAVPPNDADGDINYRGATRGIAHRYASLVAENMCAVKLAEAEAELALLEAREDAFVEWLTDYKNAADKYVTDESSYARTPQQTGSGLAILRFNDIEANKETYASLLSTRYANLSTALDGAKTEYDLRTDRTSGSNRASVIQAASNSGCVAHYDAEIARLKTLFATAETTALGNGSKGIKEERNAVKNTNLVVPPKISLTTTTNPYTIPDTSAVSRRAQTGTDCLDRTENGRCVRDPRPGETCPQSGCAGRTRAVYTTYYRCPGGSYTVSGSVAGSYRGTHRSGSFSTTYTAAARGESTSASCPGFAAQQGGTVESDGEAYVRGATATASSLPADPNVASPAALRALGKASLLGSYYPSHTDRGNLTATGDSDRRTAGRTLVASAGTVPAGSPDAVEDYSDAYTTAYDTAFRRAAGHMGGSVWENFDWRYAASTLLWAGYAEDPATAFSDSSGSPRDGTGCDLVSVASDGSVSVEATRLDFETSSFGKGSVFGTRTDAQRTCKIKRQRTPELELEYQPGVPSGTDTSKAATFWHVNYKPTEQSGRFQLYAETEIFAVRAQLADMPPVFCGSNLPAAMYVSHASGAQSSIAGSVSSGSVRTPGTRVLSPAGYSDPVSTAHCFRGFISADGAPARVAVFDDTAHSAMNIVYMERDPGDASTIDVLSSGGALTAEPAVAYPGDTAQRTAFYGTAYSMPASLGGTTGWDALASASTAQEETAALAQTAKNRIAARDKTASPNLPAVPADTSFEYVSAMTFDIGFLDCRPDVENVVFLPNIVNADAASNQANSYAGITSALEAPLWYYPPWRSIKGQTRTAAAEEPGTPIEEGLVSGIYTHPQSSRYGWVIAAYNNIATDKQPVAGFWNRPDVKHADPNRPPSVTLEEHRRVCLGDRSALPHYRSANAALLPANPARDVLGHPTDRNPQQALVVWSEHNPVCDTSDACDRWQTRCYIDIDTPASAKQTDCPADGQTLPARVTRFDDKAMTDANIRRVILDSDLADTEQAAREAADLISDKATISDGATTRQRWPWLTAGEKVFTCDSEWWYCIRPAVTLHGIEQYEWLQTRQLRVAFQYPLPKWGNILVSTLDRPAPASHEDPTEQAIKISVQVYVQIVSPQL